MGVESLWHTTQHSYHVVQPQLHYLYADLDLCLKEQTLSYQECCTASGLLL